MCLVWFSIFITQQTGGPVDVRHATPALDEFIQIIAFLMLLITAILTSRTVTVGAEERIGQLITVLRQSPLVHYRGKPVVVILTVLCIEMVLFTLVTVLTGPIGPTVIGSCRSTLPPALTMAAYLTLVISAVWLTLSACLDKQSVGLGAAATGGLIVKSLPYACLGKFSWLPPWGIVPTATPIDIAASRTSTRESDDMMLVSHPRTLAVLVTLVVVGWTVVAHLVIVHQENHRWVPPPLHVPLQAGPSGPLSTRQRPPAPPARSRHRNRPT